LIWQLNFYQRFSKVSSCPARSITTCQAPHDFQRAAFVYAQAHERAITINNCPVSGVAVAFNAHGIRPPILTLPGWAE
jgi:hypothetical protein